MLSIVTCPGNKVPTEQLPAFAVHVETRPVVVNKEKLRIMCFFTTHQQNLETKMNSVHHFEIDSNGGSGYEERELRY